MLRTHTTAVSSRMLFNLAQDYKKTGVFTPKKYFSIDRVFRNESLDATHLAEFHQIEGLVADVDLTLGHLMGVIEAFFQVRTRGWVVLRGFFPTAPPETGAAQAQVQARVQPVHGAEHGDFQLARGSAEVRRGGQQRHVQARGENTSDGSVLCVLFQLRRANHQMLTPMGLPDNVRVVAWGLGLERPTMIRNKIDDVRQISGYQQPINIILRQNPVVRLGK